MISTVRDIAVNILQGMQCVAELQGKTEVTSKDAATASEMARVLQPQSQNISKSRLPSYKAAMKE